MRKSWEKNLVMQREKRCRLLHLTMRMLVKPTTGKCSSFSRFLATFSTADPDRSIDTDFHQKHPKHAHKMFDRNPTSQSIGSWNRSMRKHVEYNQFPKAQDLFDKMPVKVTSSYNTILSGLNKTKNPEKVYCLVLEMERAGLRPNENTISLILIAVLNTVFKFLVPQIHARVVCLALNGSVFVGTALMKAYVNVGECRALRKVFDEIVNNDATSWTALVSSYMELGCLNVAQKAFDVMPEKDVVAWTALVKGYIANKKINNARSVFNKMPETNVVSWTVMISGYEQSERFFDALNLFRLMVKSGTMPNTFTYSSVLNACARCSSLVKGRQVHSSILKFGIHDDLVLLTSLVRMYAQCEEIDTAFGIFESIKIKNLALYNSMIGGFVKHRLEIRALEEFEKMIKVGVSPDRITFVNVLSACGGRELIEEGEKHFNSMITKYGIRAQMDHYACMVVLYVRAGQLEKAEKLIKGMPFKPDLVVWGALLGACGLNSCLELGKFASEGISRLKNEMPAVYSKFLKINGESGVSTNIAELKRIIKENGMSKHKERRLLDR